MLLYQLKNDDDVVGRIDAAKELAKLGTPEAVAALKQAVLKDAFWAVQAEAARALGGMRTETARDALLDCLNVKHPKARRGVVQALGQFRYDEKAAAVLEAMLHKGDASYYVEGAAAHALGQTRTPRAFEVLSKVAMKKESLNDVIRANALTGMTELKDERVLPIAIEWTRMGNSNPVRGVATSVLGRLGQLSDRAKSDAYDRLVDLLQDDWLRVRLNAIAALAELKEPKAVAELERTRTRDLDGRVIRFAREAIRRLRDGADKGDEIKKLREDFDKLSEENRGLKDRVEKIEGRANGAGSKRAAAAARKTTGASRNGASKPRAKASSNGARHSANGRKAAARPAARARR